LSDRDSYCSAGKYVECAQKAVIDSDWPKVIELCLWFDMVHEQAQLDRTLGHAEQVQVWETLMKDLRKRASEALGL
jgi:hypothetical protein